MNYVNKEHQTRASQMSLGGIEKVYPEPQAQHPPDGLYIDYQMFSDITKGVLKNANVMRKKSFKSPSMKKGLVSDVSSRQTGS